MILRHQSQPYYFIAIFYLKISFWRDWFNMNCSIKKIISFIFSLTSWDVFGSCNVNTKLRFDSSFFSISNTDFIKMRCLSIFFNCRIVDSDILFFRAIVISQWIMYCLLTSLSIWTWCCTVIYYDLPKVFFSPLICL